MNNLDKIFIANMVLLLLLSACVTASPDYAALDWNNIRDSFPDSQKGYELYSWESDGEWIFTLTTGTNRSKSFEEITSTETKLEDEYIKITVNSTDDLVTLIERLPAGVDLLWSGINLSGEVEEGTMYFTYPPDEVMDRVVEAAVEQGVQLHTLQTP